MPTRQNTNEPPATWPAEARRLWQVLYEDEDNETIRGVLPRPGISEGFFVELVIGCLFRYHESATRWEAAHREMHRELHRQGCDHEKQTKKAAAWLVPDAKRKLVLDILAYRRCRHDHAVAGEKAYAKLIDPVVCLYALFTYLVEHGRARRGDSRRRREPLRGTGIEFCVRRYFPQILTAAGLHPRQAHEWTPVNLLRRFRRRGGKRAAQTVAFYLCSTDDRLKPYRPPRPANLPEPNPQHAELIAASIGHAVFRIPHATKAAPRKRSRGGQ